MTLATTQEHLLLHQIPLLSDKVQHNHFTFNAFSCAQSRVGGS